MVSSTNYSNLVLNNIIFQTGKDLVTIPGVSFIPETDSRYHFLLDKEVTGVRLQMFLMRTLMHRWSTE